jgi:hypothetical protein
MPSLLINKYKVNVHQQIKKRVEFIINRNYNILVKL